MLLLTGLRDLLRRPYQTALMILGVALGVAVVVPSIWRMTRPARLRVSTEVVTGKATHQIVGGPGGVLRSVYRELRVTRRALAHRWSTAARRRGARRPDRARDRRRSVCRGALSHVFSTGGTCLPR
jgi:hypothetical protein